MARKAEAPQNRRTAPPENRRVQRPATQVPLRARLAVLRERWRLRIERYRAVGVVVGRVVVGLAAAAGLVAVSTLVQRHVATSPRFATRMIEVHGAEHLSHDEVARAAGLAVGQNVFAVGPAPAQASLRLHPWIESATVQRRLPDRFEIVLRERRPVALLAMERLYLVDETGFAFKSLGAGDPSDLPLITGLDAGALQRDKQGAASSVVAAVALLRDYEDAGLIRQNVLSEIHVEGDGSLSLYVGADPTYVRLGKAPFRTKLARLREVFAQLGKEKAEAAYVYLDSEKRPDRVTVKLR